LTAPARIKEADLARIFKAAKRAAYPRVRVTLDGAGNVVVDAWESIEAAAEDRGNEWDVVLPAA